MRKLKERKQRWVLDVAAAQHVTKQEIGAQVVVSFTQDPTARTSGTRL